MLVHGDLVKSTRSDWNSSKCVRGVGNIINFWSKNNEKVMKVEWTFVKNADQTGLKRSHQTKNLCSH